MNSYSLLTLPLLVILLSVSDFGFSQSDPNPRRKHDNTGHFSPNLGLAFPQKEFSDLAPAKAFFGIGGAFYGQRGERFPLDIGGSFHYFWMGSETKTFNLTDEDIGDYDVESSVNASMMPVHAHVRISFLRTLNDYVFPYAEVLGGFRIFNTKSVIEVDDFTENPPEPETDNNYSLTWSYGYAGGLAVTLATNVLLDARVTMMHGGRAKYLDPESVTFNDQQEPQFERKQSKTDVLIYHLGVKLKF